ncbi:hypothetical protein BCR44DRAFT_279313 [Catenaria anguillulae PL171]|uniref:Uncharacterized protein n=1 Tax=Catenaria anguillulae PL171 TaxID=765915 RepID=A0A1Y2HQL6_9FUNG|nr:hypothetical protein BCR44DRAFT_279313 [Catenaria anguillulae PL171]
MSPTTSPHGACMRTVAVSSCRAPGRLLFTQNLAHYIRRPARSKDGANISKMWDAQVSENMLDHIQVVVTIKSEWSCTGGAGARAMCRSAVDENAMDSGTPSFLPTIAFQTNVGNLTHAPTHPLSPTRSMRIARSTGNSVEMVPPKTNNSLAKIQYHCPSSSLIDFGENMGLAVACGILGRTAARVIT